MKEWSRKNEFNSFNSWKGLLYSRWYNAIVDWRDGKISAPLPPIEASIDPIHACNLCCDHCNAASYLISDLKERRMTDEHMENIVKFLSKWGVKAACWGGGGEPTLHTHLPQTMDLCKKVGLQSSVATNGTLISKNEDLKRSMAENCRWVGISVDASTKESYIKGRKLDTFQDTLDGIQSLSEEVRKRKTNCDVAFKFLIFEHNQKEIFEACKLAKELGARDFHARPADLTHQGMGDKKKNYNPYDIDLVKEEFRKCHELETDDFRVFTVVHKFNDNFSPKRDFTQCYGAPINIQMCADGNVYFCVDQRHQDTYCLGTHYPDPMNILNFWGNTKHYQLTFGDTPKKCNTRCTFGRYCKQVEELFADNSDKMCKWFT